MNLAGTAAQILAQFSTAPAWAQGLAKATLLLSAAWVVHFSLSSANPRWRSLLWRGAAAGLGLTAVWTLGLPGLEIHLRTPQSVVAAPSPQAMAAVLERQAVGPSFAQRVDVPAAVAVSTGPQQAPAESPLEAVPPIEPSRWRPSWPAAILGIWALGVALLLVRLAIAPSALRSCCGRRRPFRKRLSPRSGESPPRWDAVAPCKSAVRGNMPCRSSAGCCVRSWSFRSGCASRPIEGSCRE